MNAINKFLVFCLVGSTALVAPGQAIAQNAATDFSDSSAHPSDSALLGSTQANNDPSIFFGGTGGTYPTFTLDPDLIAALPGQNPAMTLFTSPDRTLSIQSGYTLFAGRNRAFAAPMLNSTYALPASGGGVGSLWQENPSVHFVIHF
jgi:hypothetical protein